jgi:hypothetical protein
VKFQLPIISPPLASEELEKCQTTGECCQCGMCCIAYSVRGIPSVPGDPDSVTTDKARGERCPQLDFDATGRAICLVQHAKATNQSLFTCDVWRGNIRDRFIGTLFEDLESVALERILWPTSRDEAELYERAVQGGRISTHTLESGRQFLAEGYTPLLPGREGRGQHPLVEFLVRYLKMHEYWPEHLFTAMHVGALLEFLWPQIESQMRMAGLHPEVATSELLRNFFARYHAGIPTVPACPNPSTPESSEPTTSAVKP